MGYLCLTRHEGELIRITIDPGVDTEKLLRHLLRDGITIRVAHAQAHQVRLGRHCINSQPPPPLAH